MGIVIGKFVRKKKSTFEILEKLDNEIQKIEDYGRSTEQRRKMIVGRFIILAILIYLSGALVLYFYHDQISPNKVITFAPIVAFPLIIFMIKKLLTWYYARKLRRNEKKLEKYTGEKKKLLENVMETETYKVAKQILDKFGNDSHKPKSNIVVTSAANTPIRPDPKNAAEPLVRKRASFGATPMNPPTPLPSVNVQRLAATPQRSFVGQVNTSKMLQKPLIRPLLKKDRSIVDKLVDYLLDDGPSKRYALICKRCYGHNGMAHQNEVDYLAYDCSYCFHHNPALKKRPVGRSFEASSPAIAPVLPSSDSNDSESEDGSEEAGANPSMDLKETASPSGDADTIQTATSPSSYGDEAETHSTETPTAS